MQQNKQTNNKTNGSYGVAKQMGVMQQNKQQNIWECKQTTKHMGVQTNKKINGSATNNKTNGSANKQQNKWESKQTTKQMGEQTNNKTNGSANKQMGV